MFGPIGLLIAAAISFIGIAVRHDNDLGTCLPFALLFLLIVGILALLMVLMGITHAELG